MHPTDSQRSHWAADPKTKKRIRRLICFVSHLKISGLIHEKAAQLLEKGPLFFFWFIFFECREPKVHRSTPLGLVCLIILVIKEPTWCTCWFSACQPLWWECPGFLFLPNQPRQCKPVVKFRTYYKHNFSHQIKFHILILIVPLIPLEMQNITSYVNHSKLQVKFHISICTVLLILLKTQSISQNKTVLSSNSILYFNTFFVPLILTSTLSPWPANLSARVLQNKFIFTAHNRIS